MPRGDAFENSNKLFQSNSLITGYGEKLISNFVELLFFRAAIFVFDAFTNYYLLKANSVIFFNFNFKKIFVLLMEDLFRIFFLHSKLDAAKAS